MGVTRTKTETTKGKKICPKWGLQGQKLKQPMKGKVRGKKISKSNDKTHAEGAS